MKITTVELAGMELAHCTRAAVARGILPSPDPDPGRAIQQYENYYENCYENFAGKLENQFRMILNFQNWKTTCTDYCSKYSCIDLLVQVV